MESAKETELEVISLQMARTGSLSMYTALKQLGYDPVWHSLRTHEQPGATKVWHELTRKKFVRREKLTKADMDRAMKGLQAATSGPLWAFWEELMDAYPNAKFILVERDADLWVPSMMTAAPAFVFSWLGTILRLYTEPVLGKQEIDLFYMICRGYFNSRNAAEFRINAKEVFLKHNENVKRKAAEQGRQLLTLQLGQVEWGPLCEFLNKPVPSSSFPRVNDAKDIAATIRQKQLQEIKQANWVVLKYLGPLAAIVAASWYYWKR